MTRLLSVLGVLCLLASCSTTSTEALTQIMVVVRSDITDLDSVEIRVDGMGAPKTAKASLAKDKLPRTLAVVHRGGPLGPITVTARGLVDGDERVKRSAKLSFARGKNVALVLELASACEDVACPMSGTTCIQGTCLSNTVDVDDLPKWPGSVGKLDDGVSDAGADAGIPLDFDAGVDAALDAGVDAALPDAGGDGAGMCADDQADCDGDGTCETQLGTLDDCRQCGHSCEFDANVTKPHAALSCDEGKCVATCKPGFLDVDGERGNGCEVKAFATAPSHVDVSDAMLVDKMAAAIVVDCDVTLDFADGAPAEDVDVCGQTVHPFVVAQAGGPDLIVVPVLGLDLQTGHVLTLRGTRPVVFLVFGDATLAGTLSVGAVGSTPGAGGNVSCTTGAGAGGGSGGGGGGFGSVGAAGGESYSGTAGGAAGLEDGTPNLDTLRGGCAGGTGAGGSAGGAGGAGGGAVQLSVVGTLTVSGTLAAAGGAGGTPADSTQTGGGGGGSGGGIFLEAASLVLEATAWLTANGGSGGEGSSENNVGHAGADGAMASATAAVGGTGTQNAGDGGNGASSAAAAAVGKDGGATVVIVAGNRGGGGGGGGGVGRIVLRGDACTLAGTTSPAAGVVDCP